MRATIWMGLVGVAVMTACNGDRATAPGPVPPLATVFSATGRIGATVSQFRAILGAPNGGIAGEQPAGRRERSEEHTSELQSRLHLVCRLLLEKKKKKHRER